MAPWQGARPHTGLLGQVLTLGSELWGSRRSSAGPSTCGKAVGRPVECQGLTSLSVNCLSVLTLRWLVSAYKKGTGAFTGLASNWPEH